ncbi:hypothetical protein M3223_04305 [Paenibacillus pasadenensis]|uniref:DUF7667 family protein n=1 Tax=Paenibacillus pasadenensis TaxID=217090 RepID=UPI00204237CE|nr:hypothetical protein [Paenibacillus pasadenensis]MCM3746572.1 hypothetical protein [Paenibacillus pasadenensis]
MTGLKTFHQRLAELHLLGKGRELTADEMQEMAICLHLNAEYALSMAYLENMSLVASLVHDVDWQYEICLDIEELARDPIQTKKRKL